MESNKELLTPEGLDQSKPLAEQVQELAINCATVADNEGNPPLEELAQTLQLLAYTLEDHFVQVKPIPGQVWDNRVPTPAQGVALARFLRPHFNAEDHGQRSASVSRGGAGLGDDYLYVRLSDGYEGGIDKEGRTST